MPYAVRTKPCASCSAPVTKKANPKKPWLCLGCAADKMAAAANQMYERHGPVWDQWLAAMREADIPARVLAGARAARPRNPGRGDTAG